MTLAGVMHRVCPGRSQLLSFWGPRMKETEILRSIADGVVVVSGQGKMTYANSTMCTLLEADSDKVLNAPFADFLAETELLGLLGLDDVVTDGPTWLQIVFKTALGVYRPLSATASPLAGDCQGGFVLVCRDHREVTELLNETSRLAVKEAERSSELERAKDAAEGRERRQREESHAQKLESIGQLAAGIAHEINTPIQFIGDNVVFLKRALGMLMPVVETARELVARGDEGMADHLKPVAVALRRAKLDYLSTEMPKAIEQTLAGVSNVSKIVQAMKEISHPSGGERKAVDLHRVIESAVTVARNEWKYVADLETDFDPELPPVPCYSDQISQVVLNMVVNAAHAIGDVVAADPAAHGRIVISTKLDQGFAELRIADTGTGIDPDHVGKVFDPFFTTKEVGKGTGQGLSIAYHAVVVGHGGTVDVDTAIGEGTTFIVRLPLTVPAERLSAAAPAA